MPKNAGPAPLSRPGFFVPECEARLPDMGRLVAVFVLLGCTAATAAVRHDGYRGAWYMNQPQDDLFKYKYSGGFATYPQQHIPLAVYSKAANKTFFCYGGNAEGSRRIVNLVSYYDHATGQLPRPVAVLERNTTDAHFNPTLALDAAGHVYVFCNAHGAAGRSYIFRSDKPHSIDAFTQVREENFSYSQPWPIEGGGLLWLHTRYERNRRRLFWAGSGDGRKWDEPMQLADMGQGSYQVSWARGRRVATAFDYHPPRGGLNARTNLYYLESGDAGATWTTAGGQEVATPLKDAANPALVRDYEQDGLLVYLKDLNFDADGRPVILYLTTRGYKSGPDSGPRVWHTARWTGSAWDFRQVTESDHNYDHGSLYIESDGLWRIIAPTDPGPQPHTTGGGIVVWLSRDQGRSWKRDADIGAFNGRNQTYIRRPLNAHDDFYAFWADGNSLEPSDSDLYFATKAGKVYRLPRQMSADFARPEAVR